MALTRRSLPQYVLVALAVLAYPVAGSAQAWLPEPGAFSLQVKYDYIEAPHHVNKQKFAKDQPPFGKSRYIWTTGSTYSHFITLSADYSLPFLEGSQLSLSLPFAMTNYEGFTPHQIVNDDGSFGETVDTEKGLSKNLTDIQGEFRYGLIQGPIAVTPFVGFVLPVTDYPTFGHASPGRGLKQAIVGAAFGFSHEALPGAFALVRYALQLAQPIQISDDRDNYGLECSPCRRLYRMDLSQGTVAVGYMVSEDVTLSAATAVLFRHDGINQGDPKLNSVKYIEEQQIHDQILKEFVVQEIIQANVTLTENVSTEIGYRIFVTGYNTHDSHGPTFAVTVNY